MGVTAKFMDLYNQYAQPFVDTLENIFYTNTIVFDIIAKKKAKALERKNLISKGDQAPFSTYSGWEKDLYLADDRIASAADVTGGFFIHDGQQMNPIEKDVGTWGSYYPCNIGAAMRMTETEKQMMEDFVSSNKLPDLKSQITNKMKMFIQDIQFSCAYSWYRGLGGLTGKSAYDSLFTSLYTTASWNWGVTSACPDERQFEGFYSFVLNPLVTKYSAIDNATTKYYKPKIYDFSVAAGASNYTNAGNGITDATIPFGYAAGNVDAETELISATNSSTTNVPIIIDIIQRCISNYTTNKRKPSMLLCRKEMLELVTRAKQVLAYANGATTNEKLDGLTAMGYPDHEVVAGIPVIADDSCYETKAGDKIYACPQNVFMIVDLDTVILESNKGNNWKQSGWKEVQGYFNIWLNSITATIRSHYKNRDRAGLIRMAAIYAD